MSAQAAFAHVRAWVFDLDNTLYPGECDLFAQIDARMTAYVSALLGVDAAEARRVQKQYYAEYGTTLAGLIARHRVDARDFLRHVHDIDVSPVDPDPELAALLARLPGKRLVFTNGSRAHAERVTTRLGLDGLFDDLFDIEAAAFTPKPHRAAFDSLLARHAFDARTAAMFEDLARNLEQAHLLGFTTVLIRSGKDWSHEPEHARPAGLDAEQPAHVHHVTDCLKSFLRRVVGDDA